MVQLTRDEFDIVMKDTLSHFIGQPWTAGNFSELSHRVKDILALITIDKKFPEIYLKQPTRPQAVFSVPDYEYNEEDN
jgi:hypothetical protein